MSKAKIPASLGGVEFDCTLEREASYEADVPEYAVEDGAYTSDTVLKKPLSLQLKVFITNKPVTWKVRHSGTNRVTEVKNALLDLYYAGGLYRLVTPDEVYENMAITSLSLPENDYADAMEVDISLKQVNVTTAKAVVASSYNYSGASSDSAGSTDTTDETNETKKSSILYSILGELVV